VTYYKATRTDATSFYDQTTKWRVGRIVRHPNPDPSKGLCSSGLLHISDAPGETLIGGRWPCRLFEVEPRSELVGPKDHKWGATAVKVLRELPAWQSLGPNGEAVAAHIERCRTITPEQAQRLGAARDAARDAAWYAARDAAWYAKSGAARDAAWYAASDAAWYAASGAARALVARDLITPEQFDTLYGPWASVMTPSNRETLNPPEEPT
jgi:hypothetical protein